MKHAYYLYGWPNVKSTPRYIPKPPPPPPPFPIKRSPTRPPAPSNPPVRNVCTGKGFYSCDNSKLLCEWRNGVCVRK